MQERQGKWKRVLTPEDRATIVQLAKMGTGFTTIAERLGNKVSKQRVQQICVAAGLDPMQANREIRELGAFMGLFGIMGNSLQIRKPFLLLKRNLDKRLETLYMRLQWNLQTLNGLHTVLYWVLN